MPFFFLWIGWVTLRNVVGFFQGFVCFFLNERNNRQMGEEAPVVVCEGFCGLVARVTLGDIKYYMVYNRFFL